MRRPRLTLAVLALAPACSLLAGRAIAAPKSIAVIVARHSGVDAITRDELRLIFQTKKKTWPDGSTAIPFNLPPEHPARQAFDSAVLGLSPNLVARYWIDRRVRGGDRPPNTAPTPALVVRVVSSLKGAVGYVEAESVDSSVKVIARLVDGEVVGP